MENNSLEALPYANDEDDVSEGEEEDNARLQDLIPPGCPLSLRDIVQCNIDDFQNHMVRWGLSEEAVAMCRDLRRKGKNREAAKRSREKRLAILKTLSDERETKTNLVGRKRKRLEEISRHFHDDWYLGDGEIRELEGELQRLKRLQLALSLRSAAISNPERVTDDDDESGGVAFREVTKDSSGKGHVTRRPAVVIDTTSKAMVMVEDAAAASLELSSLFSTSESGEDERLSASKKQTPKDSEELPPVVVTSINPPTVEESDDDKRLEECRGRCKLCYVVISKPHSLEDHLLDEHCLIVEEYVAMFTVDYDECD